MNSLPDDVFQSIIDEVIKGSTDILAQATLIELQQKWRIELSQKSSPQQDTAYAQIDGADGAEEWSAMLKERRATHHTIIGADPRDRRDIETLSGDLESGLLVQDVEESEIPQGSRAGEHDEDVLNSDLDDSDDDQDPFGNDDDNIATIVCVYKKVQRVGTNWTCVLMKGVVNIGGEYWGFRKGSGVFPWIRRHIAGVD